MRETHADKLKRAGCIFVDNRRAVLAETGDIITTINEGLFTKDRITGELTLGESSAGQAQMRSLS